MATFIPVTPLYMSWPQTTYQNKYCTATHFLYILNLLFKIESCRILQLYRSIRNAYRFISFQETIYKVCVSIWIILSAWWTFEQYFALLKGIFESLPMCTRTDETLPYSKIALHRVWVENQCLACQYSVERMCFRKYVYWMLFR